MKARQKHKQDIARKADSERAYWREMGCELLDVVQIRSAPNNPLSAAFAVVISKGVVSSDCVFVACAAIVPSQANQTALNSFLGVHLEKGTYRKIGVPNEMPTKETIETLKARALQSALILTKQGLFVACAPPAETKAEPQPEQQPAENQPAQQ